MTESSQPASFVEIAAQKRDAVSYGMIAGGVLMLVLTLFWAIRWQSGRDQPAQPLPAPGEEIVQVEEGQPPPAYTDRGDYLPTAIWGGMLAAVLLVAGCLTVSRKPTAGQEVYETRLLLLIVGGTAGVLTALLGFVLAWRWQEELVRWVSFGVTGGAKWIVGALAIFLGGLVVMFFSVQLARAEERNNVLLRRILYGSNAVLTGLLLLLLLAVVNIIVFLKLPDNMISTASGFKELGDPSKEFLHSLSDEVKVYLIMPENASIQISRTMEYKGLYGDCRAMLSACQAESSRVKVIPLSPATDAEEIRQTFKRLKVPESRQDLGMLVSYGKNEELSAFISKRELYEGSREGVVVFQGENRLMNELSFLAGGAQKPIVYFTQSNDEPSIGGGSEAKQPTLRRTMGVLLKHLDDRKYEVRPLVFEPGKKPDLSEATMVMIVAPRIPFNQEQIDILSEYLKPRAGGPGGKLVALLPAFSEPNSTTVSKTGLESFLGAFGIVVSEKSRLFSIPNQGFDPFWVLGTNASEGRKLDHPLTRFLAEDQAADFGNVRPVRANPDAVPQRTSSAMNVLVSKPGISTYQDDNFHSNPIDINAQMRREAEQGSNRTAREKLRTNLSVPFAAYAAERADESSPFRPKILVIGTDWFAADSALQETRNPPLYVAWMGAMLEYMREKPRGMNIEPRALGTYNLPKHPDGVSLLVLPISLMVMGIIGLGIGVWVTRRR